MSDISKLPSELLSFREDYFESVSDQTLITINNLVNKLFSTAKTNNLWWYPPKISISNADGTVLLEWEHNGKILFIDVLEDTIKYDALWGLTNEDLYQEESGDINIENNLLDFWSWIADG